MLDVHVHFLHRREGEEARYSLDLLDQFAEAAANAGLSEIWLLEHTHQFREFEAVYRTARAFNPYQKDWFARRMGGSVEPYLRLVEDARKRAYPVRLRFGLEADYIPEAVDALADSLRGLPFDFVTGAVHYIDGWGFDHKKEHRGGVDVDRAYRRYYEIMAELPGTGLFGGLAHPDSIKCFGFRPSFDLTGAYEKLAAALLSAGIYAENSGGLALNYGFPEIGLCPLLLSVLKKAGVKILPASDAHRREDVGKNITVLQGGIMENTYDIDWYLQDYERPAPDEGWEQMEPAGREEW